MAKTTTRAKVGKREIELSNLDKILFPELAISKSELIEYYFKAAPTILRHVKGRPLSLVRYPDGITGQAFFQKNVPDWTPEWIERVLLGEQDKINYLLANEEATLVWLANLACIELHQMHSRTPHFDKPDYMAFDLDPPEEFPFSRVAKLSFTLKTFIESFGYTCFVKTTGGKGVHILAPIEVQWSFEDVFDATRAIAKDFVSSHPNETTLELKKTARGGKVLVDIYRNRTYQTIVCPYSVRGRESASVSMPVTWERLETVTDPSIFNLRTAVDTLNQDGDPWEAIGAYATGLHTQRRTTAITSRGKQSPRGKKALSTYAQKRSFDKTPEPPPSRASADGHSFVIHRHHATRLHYDLRLERDGVLKSWAVPKGIPPRPGIKRLAVAVEDHPLSYGQFEGTIPQGNYGAGPVWIFAKGKYEVTKQKPDSFYFRLEGEGISSEYRLINTKGKDWLLERLETPQLDWVREKVQPMLAEPHDQLPSDTSEYLYEIKWDGIRALISLDEGQVTIRSRNQRDITSAFPELTNAEKSFRASCGLFDGEIVCLDASGKPVFEDVLHRLQQTTEGGAQRAQASHPAVCYLFDCLYLDGRPIAKEPLVKRRAWLQDAVKPDSPYRVSEPVEDGAELFEAAVQHGLEGIVAKRRSSIYVPGARSSDWWKVKSQDSADFTIVGYTPGKGERGTHFGSLQLAREKNGKLEYAGRVGTGFDERQLASLAAALRKLKKTAKPFHEKVPDESTTVWVEPSLCCEVRYASLTKAGIPRAPVFVRLRLDLGSATIDFAEDTTGR